MKNIKNILCTTALVLSVTAFAGAQEKLESMARGRISGVTGVKKNADGSVRSLLIIGRANLNKLMDADEAEENARDDAQINASTAFSEYLNKTVSVSRKRSTVTKTGSNATEVNGDVNKSASAETISVKSQEFASLSKAAIAGMKEIYAGVFNNQYVIIYAWDKAECAQLKDVVLTMSETAQTAIKEAKDAESRLKQPSHIRQEPVKSRSGNSGSRRVAPKVVEGGYASDDAGDYI